MLAANWLGVMVWASLSASRAATNCSVSARSSCAIRVAFACPLAAFWNMSRTSVTSCICPVLSSAPSASKRICRFASSVLSTTALAETRAASILRRMYSGPEVAGDFVAIDVGTMEARRVASPRFLRSCAGDLPTLCTTVAAKMCELAPVDVHDVRCTPPTGTDIASATLARVCTDKLVVASDSAALQSVAFSLCTVTFNVCCDPSTM